MADKPTRPRGLPMCIVGLDRTGGRLAAWPIVALVALALVLSLSLEAALTAWPDDDGAPAKLEAAIADLEQAADDLPDRRIATGAPARVLLEHAKGTLLVLNRSEVPVTDPASVRDLVFAEEAIRTIAAAFRSVGGAEAAAPAAEIETLTREARIRLRRVDRRLTESATTAGDAIVWVQDRGDHWQISRIDRSQYGLVRALGLALLLGGCLVVALRLVGRTGPMPPLRDLVGRPPAAAGLAAFAVFVAGSTMLVARPAALPGVSTAVTSLPRPGPCSRLEVARDVFWASEPLGVGPLTERARRRVQARARDCLGLESAVAAREASERFLARVETSAGAGGPAPFGASRPISLALMPEIREDVAHLQTSIDSLLQEVERLGVRRPARTGSPPPDSGAGVGGPAIPVTGPLTPSQPEARSGPVETGAQPTSAAATPARVATRAEPPVPAAGGPRPFVTTTAVNYRSGPSRDATKLGTLQEGTRVRLVADENGWASVRLHDGRAVFVASAYLAPIE